MKIFLEYLKGVLNKKTYKWIESDFLSESDYEKIIDFFHQDWDSYDMVEELKDKLIEKSSKEMKDKIKLKYEIFT